MSVALRLLLIGSLSTTLLVPRVLAAPASSPSPAPALDDKTKSKVAKQYVDAGLAAQSTGDYDTAISFYSKAYQLKPHPVLIFNIAQATRLAGRVDQALRLYARYLEADPHGAQASTARELFAELEARKAEDARKAEAARKTDAEQTRKAAVARQAEEARRADEARKAAEARRAEQARALAATQVAARPSATPAPLAAESISDRAASSPGRSLRIAGITAGSAGVVALGVGIGFGLHARSLSDKLSKPGAPYDRATEDAGHRANELQVAGLVGGAALLAAGAVLYWRGSVQGREQGVVLAPVLGDQLAGLAVAGRLP